MKKGTHAHLLMFLGVLWCSALFLVDARNEKNQQTFVVRYKVGEQTIPVTVVLDYKKQTEYVINMSPRATTKTVTLYDFKQKTIAYKDLTNRECFLGHLTHETLNEETDALSRIQNPVEHQPKILSLDPHRSSLTPTEIRNMAGQKTAVFCRKMNTWLVLPRESHSIQKREAEEIDERTYHRHGYHTIRYSHYGHETRRRFRNPYRNTTRHLSQRRGNASEINNSKIENSVTSLPFEDNPFPSQSLTVQQQFPRPEHLRTNFNGNSLSTHPNSNYQTPPEADVKAEPPPVPQYEYDSSTFPPNYLSRQNGYDSQIPFDSRFPAIQENQDNRIQDSTHIKKETSDYTSGNNLSQSNDSTALRYVFENSGVRNNRFPQNGHSPLYKAGNVEHKHYLEPSEFNRNVVETDTNQFNERNGDFQLNGNPIQSGIEKEPIPVGHHLNIPREDFSSNYFNQLHTQTDPDVSTNVLEIPKITKEFENLNNPIHTASVYQQNEDVHDIFEGFLNLRNNHPTSGLEDVNNSHLISSEPNRGKEHNYPDISLTNNYPNFPHSSLNNDTHYNQHRKGNSYPFSNSEVSTSTDYPDLTTKTYNYFNRITTVPQSYSNVITDSVTIKSYEPDTIELTTQKSSPKWSYNPLKPASLSNNNENALNKATHNFFTTREPAYVFSNNKYSHQRSDIPSESDHNERAKSFTSVPNSFEENLHKNNGHKILPSSPINENKEAIPSQEIRFQNILHNYKPDQIVIDVGSIPNQPSPDSTLDFQRSAHSGIEYSNRKIPSNARPIYGQKSEQRAGETRRGRPVQKTVHHHNRANNLQPRYRNDVSYQTRKSNSPQHHRRNESSLYQHRQYDNNIRPIVYPRQYAAPLPTNTRKSYPKLDSLPPGVSIHPRHPKAPYADMFHSNFLPSVPQDNRFRTLKPHRQRHHKKKGRLSNSCCRANGKNDNPQSCCRAGDTSCCSLHRRASSRKEPCCSSVKYGKSEQSVPPQQNHVRLQNKSPSPQQVRKVADDKRDRCQKEKLCRTLYESTQQVMVKKNCFRFYPPQPTKIRNRETEKDLNNGDLFENE
ncbi:hypothetical protein CDAR_466771 [Caerostris darwini]|uniref:Uncharacterized protein n=1 Tax=Caerostris darwini TaxID=1538125 RepID=A0AAV4UH33_9ARAC|nr:hypothetical protein CDAR_466771 [Caerostris darwini]